MLRQLGRLRLGSLAAGGTAAAGAAAEGGAAAGRAPQAAAAALQLADRWQKWGEGQGGSRPLLQHTSVRHMSLWSGGGGGGGGDGQQERAAAAGGEVLGDGGSFAASAAYAGSGAAEVASAAGGAPGISDLFSPAAIVAAAAGAEADVLAAAAEDSWLGTRLVQSLLVAVHDASGLAWWQSIMLTTLGMRVATLPVMIAQVKNTYRMSQVGARAVRGQRLMQGRAVWCSGAGKEQRGTLMELGGQQRAAAARRSWLLAPRRRPASAWAPPCSAPGLRH